MAVITMEDLATLIAPGETIAGIDLGTETIGLAVSDLSLSLDGDPDHDFTFSADSNGAELTILLDSTADTLTISGTVYGGEDFHSSHPGPSHTLASIQYANRIQLLWACRLINCLFS